MNVKSKTDEMNVQKSIIIVGFSRKLQWNWKALTAVCQMPGRTVLFILAVELAVFWQ